MYLSLFEKYVFECFIIINMLLIFYYYFLYTILKCGKYACTAYKIDIITLKQSIIYLYTEVS